MNFSTVRGYNAYAQFTVKIREAVANRSDALETEAAPEKTGTNHDNSRFVYSEPVDIVTISESARAAYEKLLAERKAALHNNTADTTYSIQAKMVQMRDNTAYAEFMKWARGAGVISGGFSQKISGRTMNAAIAGSGITVGNHEEYDLSIDVWSAATVTSRNAEKARAIQDLMNSTPSGINWGLLLQKLPI